MENIDYLRSRLTSIEMDALLAKGLLKVDGNDKLVVQHLDKIRASLNAIYGEIQAQMR